MGIIGCDPPVLAVGYFINHFECQNIFPFLISKPLIPRPNGKEGRTNILTIPVSITYPDYVQDQSSPSIDQKDINPQDSFDRLSDMKKDYPKEVILKDGTGVTLRHLQGEDKGLLVGMFSRVSEDDRWFLDHDVGDFRLIEGWVKNEVLDKVISTVAVLEGQIIAHATLIRKYPGAKSHTGRIRISVDPSFREKHLATWMLLDLINLAMGMGLETLTMQMVEERDSSLIRSVKKLDFSEEAVLKDYVKDRDGTPCNLVIMVKRLHRLWDDMDRSLESG